MEIFWKLTSRVTYHILSSSRTLLSTMGIYTAACRSNLQISNTAFHHVRRTETPLATRINPARSHPPVRDTRLHLRRTFDQQHATIQNFRHSFHSTSSWEFHPYRRQTGTPNSQQHAWSTPVRRDLRASTVLPNCLLFRSPGRHGHDDRLRLFRLVSRRCTKLVSRSDQYHCFSDRR